MMPRHRRLDFEVMRSVFHDKALDNHNQYNGDILNLVAGIKGRHEKITFSMHMVGNMVIEFASPTRRAVGPTCGSCVGSHSTQEPL
jgi:hypothetical protein